MFTYYKILTNSVAFFTTAILNTPKVENSTKNGFFVKFRGFGAENPYNSIPVSRSMTVSQAALKVSGVAIMVTDCFARVMPV